MNSLGIYFGPKVISVVETNGRKLTNSALIPQSAISTDELEEKVPIEVKATGIVSLLRDELRKLKIGAREATLCLSGKDLIIRTIEMPEMPRVELESAINFEVRKYIPFKVEDLISDFQITLDKQSRINLVLFVGIKKETLDKYISILSQLNIKINAIEYSAYSILRCLKLANASDKGIAGILAVDIKGKDEVNFTVLENGFPLFSRDIALTSEMGDFGEFAEKSLEEVLEKLKSEIRVSLDYYRRKFAAKDAKKIFLICEQEHRLSLEAIIREIGLGVQFIDVAKRIDRPIPYSLSFIKGYSASLSRAIRTNIEINLLAAKERAKTPKEKGFQKEMESLLKGMKLDFSFVMLGICLCIATYFFGIYRALPVRKELQNIMHIRQHIISASPRASYEELTGIEASFKTKINTIESLIRNQLYLTEPLGAIASSMPKGAWLTDLSFSNQQATSALTLNGIVSLDEGDKEFEAVSKFIANLKENPGFGKYFKDIHVNSMDRRNIGKLTATYFSISCNTK